jgi:putative 2OG-Fe(II) oxygenase
MIYLLRFVSFFQNIAFMKTFIRHFKNMGFVNLGSSFLSNSEIQEICARTKSMYEALPLNHSEYLGGDGVDGIRNPILLDNRLADLVNKIVSNDHIKEFLVEILGNNYKIWGCSFRSSKPGDNGLYLHQDGVGQVNMAICLDDNLRGIGATAVLPGSHLVRKSQKQLRVEVEPVVVNFFSFLFTPLVGVKGDVAFFSNRIWHGRFKNRSHSEHDVLLIGFFPEGYRYMTPWPQEFIDQYSGTELGKLLGTVSDAEKSIPSSCETRESFEVKYGRNAGFSLHIEDQDYLRNVKKPIKLLATIVVLKCIMYGWAVMRPLVRFVRKVRARILEL